MYTLYTCTLKTCLESNATLLESVTEVCKFVSEVDTLNFHITTNEEVPDRYIESILLTFDLL